MLYNEISQHCHRFAAYWRGHSDVLLEMYVNEHELCRTEAQYGLSMKFDWSMTPVEPKI